VFLYAVSNNFKETSSVGIFGTCYSALCYTAVASPTPKTQNQREEIGIHYTGDSILERRRDSVESGESKLHCLTVTGYDLKVNTYRFTKNYMGATREKWIKIKLLVLSTPIRLSPLQ
jgi:hypothetical protein